MDQQSNNIHLLISDLLQKVRDSFHRTFSFVIDDSELHYDSTFSKFLLRISNRIINLIRESDSMRDTNREFDTAITERFNKISEHLNIVTATLETHQIALSDLTMAMNDHRDKVGQIGVYFDAIFMNQHSNIEAQKLKLEKGIKARCKALHVLLDSQSQIMLQVAIEQDRLEKTCVHTEAFVELIITTIDELINPELKDYVSDLVTMTRARLNLEKQIHDAEIIQQNAILYVEYMERECRHINQEVHRIMESKSIGPWQVILGACMGIAGGCLGPLSMLGGSLLSAGISGTMMGLEGRSSWGEFFGGIAVGAAAGVVGGGCGQFVSGQMAGFAAANGSIGALTSNVAAGMTASVSGSITQNVLCGRIPTIESLGKAALCGAVGGAVLTGAQNIAQSDVIQSLASTLEQDLNLLSEHVSYLGSLSTDLLSATAATVITGESMTSALKSTLIASSLGLVYRSVGSHITSSFDHKTDVSNDLDRNQENNVDDQSDDTKTVGAPTDDVEIDDTEKIVENCFDTKTGEPKPPHANDDFVDGAKSKQIWDDLYGLSSSDQNISIISWNADCKEKGQLLSDDISGSKAYTLTLSGSAILNIGKQNEILGVLKQAGEEMIHQATVRKAGWSNPRLGGIIFELQQTATFNKNAINKGVHSIEAITTSSLGRGTDSISDILVNSKKTGTTLTNAQLKSGKTASTKAKQATRGTVVAEQFVIPSGLSTAKQSQLSTTIKYPLKNISSDPISQSGIQKLTDSARNGENPLTSKSVLGRSKQISGKGLQNVGKALRIVGKVAFVAGALWSITENVVDVYQGNKSIGRATLCVLLDVSGVQMGIDLYNFATSN